MKEDFPIDNNLLHKFIEENRKIWESDCDSKSFTLINMSMVRMQIPWILPKLLYAKGIQEKTGAIPVVLTWNENNELTFFLKSFGMQHIALNKMCKKNIIGIIKAIFKTLVFLSTHKDGEEIKKFKALDLDIGLNLYEDILRTSSLSTLRKCRNKIAIRKTFHLLLSLYSLDRYMKKKEVKYAITDDMAYHEGMFIKLFLKKGINVYSCTNISEKTVFLDENGEVARHNWVNEEEIRKALPHISSDNIKWVDKYLEERFEGKNGRDIDKQAFCDKRVLSRRDFEKQYNIDGALKTVVIMAHTFTDAVFNYGNYYFRDYYDWTEKTLKIASEITNVNWVLKPHPTRSSYNESADSIEDMFLRYKKDHMFLLSDDISSESIKNIADVLITIGGNAGAEYACFGIPSIIVGKPYYARQGYTIEPNSYDEYRKILIDINNIKPLTEEQVCIAKKVFYYKNNYFQNHDKRFLDEFANGLNGKYKEMTDAMPLAYFKDNNGTKEYNNRALEYVMEYMKKHDIKDTQYFIAGTKQ